MRNIKKIFIWAISFIYILGGSIWIHSYVMSDFSSQWNNMWCSHFSHSESKDPSVNHKQCLDSIYVWYKMIAWLDFDIIYKYKPIVFDYKSVLADSFERPVKINPPPIYASDKQYLKFSDLYWIIVMLN